MLPCRLFPQEIIPRHNLLQIFNSSELLQEYTDMEMYASARQSIIGYLAAVIGVAFVIILYKLIVTGVNSTTVSLSFLLVVLATSSAYGLGPGILASIAGMFCFNFFFLPPFGNLTIHDSQNWAALFVFLVTAATASQLSSAARARARDAERRREEVWKLYELSKDIIAKPDSETAVSSIARQVLEVFHFSYCAIFVPDDMQRWSRLSVAVDQDSPGALAPNQSDIEKAFITGEVQLFTTAGRRGGRSPRDEPDPARSTAYVPLKVGVRSIGVMVLTSSALERGTMEAVAGLVALALERARFLKEVSHTEALRQSDELKSALLASVSHDLRTPLTSIRAAVDNLLQEEIGWDRGALHEFHLIISEEVSRLTRLVQNLLEMARIEAGELRLSKEWTPVEELFSNVLDRCSASIRNHRVVLNVGSKQLLVRIDSRLVAEALTNLVENAARYSPSGSQIILRAVAEDGELTISVSDEGQGVAPGKRERIFDKFYRGSHLSEHRNGGTGMGLAIARGIIEAHGGRIWVESTPSQGATFAFTMPVEWKQAADPVTANE
jgi:two-component system sensor histidine kinase KdpD